MANLPPPPEIQIPADAVSATASDILKPLNDLLGDQGLNIKGDPVATEEAGKLQAAFKGPPQSVALIEAGATALSKAWAAGLGAGVAAVWTGVIGWWGNQTPATQRVALWGAAIFTAAAVLGIAYLLSSDIRGRSIASVATIQARAQVAETMLRMAQKAYIPPLPASAASATPTAPPASAAELVPLPATIPAKYPARPSADEDGWQAIALFSDGESITRYLLTKDGRHVWVEAPGVVL